jgi:hypothetical protein
LQPISSHHQRIHEQIVISEIQEGRRHLRLFFLGELLELHQSAKNSQDAKLRPVIRFHFLRMNGVMKQLWLLIF